METKKISDYEMEITTQPPLPDSIKSIINRSDIEQHIKDLEIQKTKYCTQIDKDIAECQLILDEMDKFGIKSESNAVI